MFVPCYNYKHLSVDIPQNKRKWCAHGGNWNKFITEITTDQLIYNYTCTQTRKYFYADKNTATVYEILMNNYILSKHLATYPSNR